jgi:hypothetical protein
MRHALLPLTLAATVAVAGAPGVFAAEAGTTTGPRAGLVGQVLSEAAALGAVRVYAYQLADLSLRRAVTGEGGGFLFDDLPAGLYKVIAHKPGFLPVAVLLTRTSAEAYQFLEVHLARAGDGETVDYWSLRGEVPADVLREIESSEAARASQPDAGGFANLGALPRFAAEMTAMTGTRDLAAGRRAAVSRGELDVRAHLGSYNVGVVGSYAALETDPFAEVPRSERRALADGEASSILLRFEDRNESALTVSTLSNRMTLLRSGRENPMALDDYRVAWEGNLGSDGRSSLQAQAQYTSESAFFGRGWVSTSTVADASETLRLEGRYSTLVGERHSLEAGVRYRQREESFRRRGLVETLPADRLDVFSRGGWQVAPSVLVEYGLYTTLRDGSVSLTPRGGFVLQLGPRWQAATRLSRRLDADESSLTADFSPILLADRDDFSAAIAEEAQVMVSRSLGESDESVSLTATHRRLGDRLRLYFSENFFDYLQNVYLVEGDSLPEVQFAVSRRLTSDLHTRLESSFASGGGGTVRADRRDFENDVQYFVTSLDTLYRPTATGLFLAFHRLEQQLDPIAGQPRNIRSAEAPLHIESLEMVLTQNLNVLVDLAAEWALRLDLEFSRGTSPLLGGEVEDEVRRRVLGGIAIRF